MPFVRLGLTAILGPPVVAGALICAASAILAQLGRRSARWDVLTHAAPLYLAGGALAMAAALALGEPFRALALILGGAAAVAALLLMAPEYLRSTGPRASARDDLFKVIQFNAWGDRGDIGRTIAWLNREQPDVLVMQETTRALRITIEAGTGLRLSPGGSTVAIFSREPSVTGLPPAGGPGGPMMLRGVRLNTAAGETAVFGVHYPWPTEADRLIGAPKLAQAIRAHPTETTILAGDFNSTPWSFARRREDQAFGLIRRTRALFSWPAWLPLPLLPIDHVYAGSAWATVQVKRGPNLGSDHYPVVVILAPRGPTPGVPRDARAPPAPSPPAKPAASQAPPLRGRLV
jgi:endonuclease/exonuclease/phosphatase (EEP) superfamily protein YafD